MRFRVLGAVEIWRDGRRLPVRAGVEQSLLALLLTSHGQAMDQERLVALLWERPPASARAQLHNAVSKLRRLGPAGALARRIVCTAGGYRLDLDGYELDLSEFRRLSAAGRECARAGELGRAVEVFGEALASWRGTPLAGCVEPMVSLLRPALENELLRTVEARLDARLSLGQFDEVLAEVGPVVAQYPHHEGLYRRQIEAFAACGRRADALAGYRRAFRRLVDDLGVEPGPELQEQHARLLDGTLGVLRCAPGCPGRQPHRTGPPQVAGAGR